MSLLPAREEKGRRYYGTREKMVPPQHRPKEDDRPPHRRRKEGEGDRRGLWRRPAIALEELRQNLCAPPYKYQFLLNSNINE